MNSEYEDESNRSFDSRNKKKKHVQYMDSSITSESDYNELDDYLEEAMGEDSDDEDNVKNEEINDEDESNNVQHNGKSVGFVSYLII